MTLIHFAGLTVCRQILHNTIRNGLSKNSKDLYSAIEQEYSTSQNKKVWKLYSDQKNILMPTDGETNSELFDICLITNVIYRFKCYKCEIGLKGLIDKLVAFRNRWFHNGQPNMNENTFQTEWRLIFQLFKDFSKVSFITLDISAISGLEQCSLDGNGLFQNHSLMSVIDVYQVKCSKLDNVSTRLEKKLSNLFVDIHDQKKRYSDIVSEINLVWKEAILQNSKQIEINTARIHENAEAIKALQDSRSVKEKILNIEKHDKEKELMECADSSIRFELDVRVKDAVKQIEQHFVTFDDHCETCRIPASSLVITRLKKGKVERMKNAYENAIQMLEESSQETIEQSNAPTTPQANRFCLF